MNDLLTQYLEISVLKGRGKVKEGVRKRKEERLRERLVIQ